MEFEWNDAKRRSNLIKHGVEFRDILDAFEDGLRLLQQDFRQDYGENRVVMTARSEDYGRIMVIVYVQRSADVVRIISARRANRREIRKYG